MTDPETKTCATGKACCGLKKNVGTADRVARLVIGVVLVALVFTGPMTPWGWLGVPLIASALVGWCGLYTACGINTCCSKKDGDTMKAGCCGGSCHSKDGETPTPAA